MIGYYIHHVGRGHLHLALSIVGHLDQPVTALSSLAKPADWPGDWVQLPRDDEAAAPVDPTAHGQLHWVPRYDQGLQGRMAMISEWITLAQPAAMVVDVSVEILLLSRLLGLPVITVTLPGRRQDPAHKLGHQLADAILAPWPARYQWIAPGLNRYQHKTSFVGAISRFDERDSATPNRRDARTVLVLEGLGGNSLLPVDLAQLQTATPDWRWATLGARNWTDDPWPAICAADVVIAHCGLGSVADVAAARKPLIAIPAARPHQEQVSTAAALKKAGLALIAPHWPVREQWSALLDKAMQLDGQRWSQWSDRAGAVRAAAVIDRLLRSTTATAAT